MRNKQQLIREPSATAGLEFQIPPYVARYASFMFSFLGRGICKFCEVHLGAGVADGYCAVYIFVGSILLHDHTLRIVAGSIVGIIGVVYVVLEFIPSIEPPSNMREGEAGWGAEQV